MSERRENPVDVLLREAMLSTSAGVDLDEVQAAVADAVTAIKKQMARLSEADYSKQDFDKVAKAVSHTIKGLDELVRLAAFAKGQPDSRPDLGGDWLKALSDTQLRQVEQWLHDGATPADA